MRSDFVDPKRLRQGSPIGRGGFGVVFKGELNVTPEHENHHGHDRAGSPETGESWKQVCAVGDSRKGGGTDP